MGISTQHISMIAQTAVNQGLRNGVGVTVAALQAQEDIGAGTTELLKAALADNSRITLTETRITFHESPATVSLGEVQQGELSISPPQDTSVPELRHLVVPNFPDLPRPDEPPSLSTRTDVYAPEIGGDLVLPGGMVRIDDFSLGAASVTASPQAPEFTAPILSTSASEDQTHPSLEQAARDYVAVTLIGSAQSLADAALADMAGAGTGG